MAPTLIYERLLPIALTRLTIHILLLVPKNGVKPKCRQNQKTDAVALTRHCRALLLGIIPGWLSCFDAPSSSDHCFLMCGGPEPRGTWGLIKAFVSFGLQKKFVLPGNRATVYPHLFKLFLSPFNDPEGVKCLQKIMLSVLSTPKAVVYDDA